MLKIKIHNKLIKISVGMLSNIIGGGGIYLTGTRLILKLIQYEVKKARLIPVMSNNMLNIVDFFFIARQFYHGF